MAKEKMMKMRISKQDVHECALCNLNDKIRDAMETKLNSIENPINLWSAVDKATAPGYQISTYAPATEKSYWNTEDGYERIDCITVCKRCAETVLKCLTRLDDAESICFSKADAFKDVVFPADSELVEKVEE